MPIWIPEQGSTHWQSAKHRGSNPQMSVTTNPPNGPTPPTVQLPNAPPPPPGPEQPTDRPRRYRRGWVIGLIALFVGIGLGAASSGSKTKTTTVTAPAQTVVKTVAGSTKTVAGPTRMVPGPTRTVTHTTTVTKTVTAPSQSSSGVGSNSGSGGSSAPPDPIALGNYVAAAVQKQVPAAVQIDQTGSGCSNNVNPTSFECNIFDQNTDDARYSVTAQNGTWTGTYDPSNSDPGEVSFPHTISGTY
jgi:hypothetical protein